MTPNVLKIVNEMIKAHGGTPQDQIQKGNWYNNTRCPIARTLQAAFPDRKIRWYYCDGIFEDTCVTITPDGREKKNVLHQFIRAGQEKKYKISLSREEYQILGKEVQEGRFPRETFGDLEHIGGYRYELSSLGAWALLEQGFDLPEPLHRQFQKLEKEVI